MRTTLTLDEDLAKSLQARSRTTGRSFKDVVNEALRAGLRTVAESEAGEPIRIRTFKAGVRSGVNLDQALRVAAGLEDAEIVQRMRHDEASN